MIVSNERNTIESLYREIERHTSFTIRDKEEVWNLEDEDPGKLYVLGVSLWRVGGRVYEPILVLGYMRPKKIINSESIASCRSHVVLMQEKEGLVTVQRLEYEGRISGKLTARKVGRIETFRCV